MTRENARSSREKPAWQAEEMSRRAFIGKVTVAGAAGYLLAGGVDRAQAVRATMQVSPVSPTLRLSQMALQTPFADGLNWLSAVRDFLTRQGAWSEHGVDLGEIFIKHPAPGVVVAGMLSWESSLGFGALSVGTGSFSCDGNNCEKQFIGPGGGDDEDKCTNNWCGEQECQLDTCDANRCSDHTCDGLSCNAQVASFTDFASEIQDNWSHPFVQELARYFGMETFAGLTQSVQHYIGRNMYDASAVR